MFFEDEKENLDSIDNLDDLDLDLDDDIDDESISWDELLKDSSTDVDIVSIASDKSAKVESKTTKTKKSKEKVKSIKEDIQSEDVDITLDDTSDKGEDVSRKKDAFEVFGGDDKEEVLVDVDNVMDDEDKSILNQLDDLEVSQELEKVAQDEDNSLGIGIKTDDKQVSIPVIAGAIFAAVLVLGSLFFIFVAPKKANIDIAKTPLVQEGSKNNAIEDKQVKQDNEQEQIPVMNDNEAKKLKPDKKIVVSVESAGRLNPFLPTFDDFNNNYYAGIPSDILMPPDKYGEETDAQELLKVSVSGILFDSIKPSAIITINGIDYFVQKNDMVDDFLVLDINRQFVVIKKGTNIYKASVGERFSQNGEISGAAVYGSGGIRQYKSISSDYTSASDVEVRPIEE